MFAGTKIYKNKAQKYSAEPSFNPIQYSPLSDAQITLMQKSLFTQTCVDL